MLTTHGPAGSCISGRMSYDASCHVTMSGEVATPKLMLPQMRVSVLLHAPPSTACGDGVHTYLPPCRRARVWCGVCGRAGRQRECAAPNTQHPAHPAHPAHTQHPPVCPPRAPSSSAAAKNRAVRGHAEGTAVWAVGAQRVGAGGGGGGLVSGTPSGASCPNWSATAGDKRHCVWAAASTPPWAWLAQ